MKFHNTKIKKYLYLEKNLNSHINRLQNSISDNVHLEEK